MIVFGNVWEYRRPIYNSKSLAKHLAEASSSCRAQIDEYEYEPKRGHPANRGAKCAGCAACAKRAECARQRRGGH